MDPLSIAAGAAGLAAGCATISRALYTWVSDTVDVDVNVSALCDEVSTLSRVLESISKASVQVPSALVAEIDPDNGLWSSVSDTLENIRSTINKLNQLLADVHKTSSVFSRGFLRKPTKHIKFSVRSKDISTYNDRIKSYNAAMASALQMINVCLLIHSNSSQDSVFKVLSGLKSQVRRVEFALQGRTALGAGPPDAREEEERVSRSLRQFARVADNFHSSASTIMRDGARSTVWGGSILGDALTEDQFSNIERWIPPPVAESPQAPTQQSDWSSTTAIEGTLQSDSEDDIDKDLTKRLEELAMESQRKGDYERAQSFYQRAIDRGQLDRRHPHDLSNLRLSLAYACMHQEKWASAQEIVAPMAFERNLNDIRVYHSMHALALFHLKKSDFDTAHRFCKRALWGKRKVLGKTHATCWDSLALLASICASRNDVAEAEAHRSFIPPNVQVTVDPNSLAYLQRSLQEGQSDLVPTRQGAKAEPAEATAPSPAETSLAEYSTPIQSPLPPEVASSQAPHPLREPLRSPQSPERPARPRQFSPKSPSQPLPIQHQSQNLAQYTPPSDQSPGVYLPVSTPQQASTSPTVFQPAASQPKASLIVGVCYRATQTMVSFGVARYGEVKEDIITEWPGAGNVSKTAVPTVLYYDQDQRIVGWGLDTADALAPTGYPKPGVQKVEWFMLRLMVEGNTHFDQASLPPLPLTKDAIQVSADYLLKLRHAIARSLQKTLGDFEEEAIRWCFTVPGIWNDAGKSALRTAIQRAGYLRDESDGRLLLVAEPMGTALYCERSGLVNLKQHDALIIVDCGEGTVDLIAYEVIGENPFAVTECTAGSGDSCGSNALNRNFSNLARATVKKMRLPEGSKTAGRVYAKAIMDFANRIKADFRNNGQKWAVDVGIEAEFPDAGIEEGYLVYTNDEIRSCFDPVMERIVELVKNQIVAVGAQNRILQNIILTGEFASSDYLLQTIRMQLPNQFKNNLVRPMDVWTAAVKGATIAGLRHTSSSTLSIRSLFVTKAMGLPRDGSQPVPRSHSLYGHTQGTQSIVDQGQHIFDGQVVEVAMAKFYQAGWAGLESLVFADHIFVADGPCPTVLRRHNSTIIATVTTDLSNRHPDSCFRKFYGPNGPYYFIEYTLEFVFRQREMEVQSVFQGLKLGGVTRLASVLFS